MSNDKKLKQFDEELLDGYPDPSNHVYMSLTPQFPGKIPSQSYETLVATAYALGRFVAHIQFFGNQYQARVSNLKKRLERERARTIASLQFKAKETDRSKMAAAYAHNPELGRLEEELEEAEEKARYYQGMPEAFRELINIIKYELRRKEQEREKGRFNAPA